VAAVIFPPSMRTIPSSAAARIESAICSLLMLVCSFR
jgi:hypothetical protein